MKHIQRFHETESKVQAGLGYAEARKRSNNVQHIFLILLCALAWSTGAWGIDHLPIAGYSCQNGSTNVWSGSTNWNDKSTILQFNGIPYKLSFKYERSVSIATGVDWYIDVSPDNSTWERLWTKDDTNSGSESNIEIKNHSVRYIKFCYSGNYGGKFSDVSITEHPTVYSVDKTSIAFGTKTKGESVAPQGITLTHVNAASSTTVACSDNANFTVTPTTASTGKDKWGTATFNVTYKNTNVGAHSATITISDGTNAKTVSVSGTTQTTYYGQATAVASAGGTAGVSFTSYDAATSSNATTSTANTTATSGSKTAYYKAVPNTGYAFKGWIKGTNSYSSANVLSESLTYNPSVTYNSEASGSPTVTTYKAWFAPRFFFSASATSSNETLGTVNVDVAEEMLGNVGATSGTVATTATFTATPKDGDCEFLGWYTSDAFSGNPISTSATYTENLTNSVVGSTVYATHLYALFKKKQNLTWVNEELDLNLVLGVTGQSSAASVTSGKTITYTSSNENALTIAADGSITTIGLGSSTVTASVAGDEVYREETISRVFNVGERKQATFTPSWGETLEPSLELSETATISLVNVNGDFSVTKGAGDYFSWERTNSNTITITALAAGTTTLTLTQPGDGVFLDGNSVTYTITVTRHPNTFAVAAESKAMKVGEVWENVVTNAGNNNTVVSYSTEGVATYDATYNKITAVGEGSTTITFTQAETTEYAGATKTIDVAVTKYTNTLSVSLSTQDAEVGGTIGLDIVNRNNYDAAITATISEQHQTSSVNNGSGVISFDPATNKITALNAGTAKIKFSQLATAKYTAYEGGTTYDITVSKISNTIVVRLDGEQKNSQNVARGDQVALSYTSVSDGDYHVTLTSGSTATATISAGTITAGNTDGTNIWTIRQDETYKYEAAETTFRIQVNSIVKTDSYLHTSLLNGSNYSWNTGSGNDYEVSVDYIPQELRFKAWYENWAGVNESVTVVWKDAQGNPLGSQKFNLNRDQNEIHYVRNLPEGTRKFSFSSTGDFRQYLSDVYVVRKTYIKASSDITNYGSIYTDNTASATITVEWGSSNGGDIYIESNNSHFVASPSSITGTENSNGTRNITLTYTPDPEHLGAEEATIRVYDLFHSQTISLTATAQKYTTTIGRGSNTETATTVDGPIANAFAFTGTSTDYPSDDSNADFYYTISHTQTSAVNKGEGVISYDPATNTITGLNAGTARLTIYQKKTLKYNATSQTFDFTVSKLENNTLMSLSTRTLDVDGTATVGLMNADSDGSLSAAYSDVAYTNESQNREGGLLSFTGNTLTGVNAGSATVTITQAETYKYVAKSQQFNVTVNKLTQTLTWDNSDLETTMQLGSTLEGNTATSSVGLTPVTYASGNTAAITVDANTGVLTAAATGSNISITATQAGNYKYLPATLTRLFSVFNKQTPAFIADAHFTGASGRVEYTCTATIRVTGVGADSEEGFTITNGDNSIIGIVRDGETITITGLAIGSTTLTLAQAGNEDYIAKSQTYNIEVYMPDDFLTLAPATTPSHNEGQYRKVFLNRTLKEGLSTIALPFNTTVAALTDRSDANDWVAQLETVTHTQADAGTKDEYTLYFKKVEGGVITANKPYVLHLGAAVVNPTWTDMADGISVSAASATEQSATKGYTGYGGWAMSANYEAGMNMEGKYGVVNGVGL